MQAKNLTDDYWMQKAIIQAKIAKENGEVPVGAVLTDGFKIISSGYNQTISKCDPTAHAEIITIRQAAINFKNHRLERNLNLYVTLEPCAMCYGAIVQARIRNIFFGAFDKKTGCCGSCIDLTKSSCFNHKPISFGGILEKDCSKLLKTFFKNKRN